VIRYGPKALRKVPLEISHCHLATKHKSHRPSEESESDENPTHELKHTGGQHPGVVKLRMPSEEPKQVLRPVAGEQERKNHSYQGEGDAL
jgi:hypothetical protein